MPETFLRRALRAGGPIAHWQIGTAGETRYDVPDQPMSGEMDPFFFLAGSLPPEATFRRSRRMEAEPSRGGAQRVRALFELVVTGPTAGNEVRLAGTRALWCVRLPDKGEGVDALKVRFGGLAVAEGEGGRPVVEDPDCGMVTLRADGGAEAEGRMIDPKSFTIEGRR
ncbi:hypothetical protein [Aureimonas sp. SK2]|uniref:hypothetical protein n=1 Tax=Aureimonas sp. SK2 TaxID=3015992 RepID=UPI002444AC3D|nr:hypothetical protein [Aureimonas sp. SK2]